MSNDNYNPPQKTELSPAKRRLLELLAVDRKQRARPIVARPLGEPAALSFGQRRLWFLDRWSPGSTAYNEFVRLRLDGPLDVEALRAGLVNVVDRHAVLRTVFRETPDGPIQVVDPSLVPVLDEHDLSTVSPAEREATLAALQQRELTTPFDLTCGPLVRALLVRMQGRMHTEQHELMFSVHHIACDAWSLGIFIRELGACYAAYVRGESPALPALDIQYADYARWQLEAAQTPNASAQLEYWKRQLPEPAPVLQLPFARPRPDVPTSAGITAPLATGIDLVAKVQRLAREQDATPFMILLAAFQALLHRYTGELDVRVGTPVAGRTRVETEALIGFFVNTLVMRADLSGEPTFRELVSRVRASCLAAYAHQEVAFEHLVDAVGARRAVGQTPLFQAVFVLQNAPLGELRLPGLRVTPIEVDRGTSKFDLVLSMTETRDGYQGGLECSADLFDQAATARMVAHFIELLSSAVATPDQPVAALSLLTPSERRELEVAQTRTRAYPSRELLHEGFARQAAARPGQIAVSGPGAALTYAELDRRSNQLAHALRARGVGPDVLVGLYLQRSVEMIVAILGILKAGGAYVPLDPAYPAERRAFIIEDSGVRTVLTQQALAPSIAATGAATGVETIVLDGPEAGTGASAAADGPVEVRGAHPDQLAYAIYTSGSTGNPKGALITHRNVARLFTATAGAYGFNERDVWTLFHSVAFDFSVWEIWGALLYGGRLVVVPYETSRSPHAFYDLLVEEGVTVLNQTPSAFRQLIREDEQRGGEPALALRYVIFGGEALELSALAPWYQRHPDTRPQLVNMYGITETTVHVTYRPLRLVDLTSGRGSVIGAPIGDLECYVLDAHRQPVPVGVPGELYVGGPGVARGYLNRPELTAERFVPHPFRPDPEARLYKTGDLVRRLDDRDLEYLGRLDLQVKIRGFRIELEEIEAVLLQHPAIREAVVLAREDVPGDQRLLAYVVLAPGAGVDLGQLRGHVGAKLPEYMVPSAVIVLDAMPMTVNGKLDRKALPAPSTAHVLAPVERAAVAGELEPLIAEQWKQVLQLDVVGATDNFFDVGGHSLHIATLQSRLREHLGRDVPMVALFKYPTIRELARHLEGSEPAEPAPATPTVRAQARAARRGAQTMRRHLRRSNRSGQDDE
jgi:amino acid adenylation domain-containing protein